MASANVLFLCGAADAPMVFVIALPMESMFPARCFVMAGLVSGGAWTGNTADTFLALHAKCMVARNLVIWEIHANTAVFLMMMFLVALAHARWFASKVRHDPRHQSRYRSRRSGCRIRRRRGDRWRVP
jgi:hypothetical protein